MMCSKVLILEDNNQTAKTLRKIILDINSHIEVEIVNSLSDAYVIIMEKTIDVFIIDIILDTQCPGDTSGMRFVQKIREIPKYSFTPVIFITALSDPELYAYRELHSFGYIEKPFSKDKVKQLLEQALLYKTPIKEERKVYLKNDGVLYAIDFEDIIYVQVRHHKMFLYTKNYFLEIPHKTIKTFMKENESIHLIQCSRNTLINFDYIDTIDLVNKYVKLKGIKESFDIGITFKEKLAEWTNDYWKN